MESAADVRMLARLADIHEFHELKKHFDVDREEAVQALSRKTFANPEGHDRLEWEKLRAYYAGVDAVLALPVKARRTVSNREESR